MEAWSDEDQRLGHYSPLNGEELVMNEPRNRSGGKAGKDYGNLGFMILIFLVPACGGLLFGYDIGAMSSACNQFTTGNLPETFGMSESVTEACVSASLVGAIIGSIIVFAIGDFLGRNGVLAVAGSLYFGGALIEGSAFNLYILFSGRILYGIGIGFAMHSAPLYISETTPPQLRGVFISAKECFIVVGILSGYIMGFVFGSIDAGWRYIFYMATIPSVALIIGSMIIPSSPRWILLRSVQMTGVMTSEAEENAKLALVSIRRRSPDEIFSELESVKASISEQVEKGEKTFIALFKETNLRRGLLIGCGLVILQQISGQPSVLYYASTVFANAGLNGQTAVTFATIGVGIVKLLMTIVSTILVDKAGRRPMLLVGISLMAVALTIMGSVSVGFDPNNDQGGFRNWATIIGMMVFVSGYQLGFGPISWLIISEVFPLQARSKALSIAVLCNFGSNLIVSSTYLSLQTLITPAGAYFLYDAVSIFSIFFVLFLVIETKGKTLEEIEEILSSSNILVVSCSRKRKTLVEEEDEQPFFDEDDSNGYFRN